MTTKTAKKTARKSTKKSARGGAVKGATSARKAFPKSAWENIPENAVLKVVGENPRRKGSTLHKLYETVRKTRTVGAFEEKGGARRWLPGMVKRGFVAPIKGCPVKPAEKAAA